MYMYNSMDDLYRNALSNFPAVSNFICAYTMGRPPLDVRIAPHTHMDPVSRQWVSTKIQSRVEKEAAHEVGEVGDGSDVGRTRVDDGERRQLLRQHVQALQEVIGSTHGV